MKCEGCAQAVYCLACWDLRTETTLKNPKWADQLIEVRTEEIE